MGSGASAVDTAKIQDASTEELAEAIKGLGPDDLKKLQNACKKGGAVEEELKKEESAAKEEAEKKEEPAAIEEEKKESPAAAEEKKEELAAKEEETKEVPAAKEEEKKEEPAATEEAKKEEPAATQEETKEELAAAEAEKKEEPAATEGDKKEEPAKKALELTAEQKDNVRKAFDAVDTDKSGTVEVKEFMVALKALDIKMTEDEVAAVFKKFDDNKDSKLQFDEYVNMILGALA